MKKILITGAGSYIGTSFENWLSQWPEEYSVETVDMQQENWRDTSFAGFDAVFHVAGIAHRKETEKNAMLYQAVNCDLAVETAGKAKKAGVPLFIFLSSMSVYGLKTGTITKETPCVPTGPYGRSILQAEQRLCQLEDESFCVARLRPPMVYGSGCRGNYPRLRKLALKLPFFPNKKNERSMIYIDTLCEFVRKLIDKPESGLLFPQNAEYVSTANLVQNIAAVNGKKLHLTGAFSWGIALFHNVSIVQKVFGNLTYDKAMSGELKSYQVCGFGDSVKRTEYGGNIRG